MEYGNTGLKTNELHRCWFENVWIWDKIEAKWQVMIQGTNVW